MAALTIAAIAIGSTGIGLQVKGQHEQGKQEQAKQKSDAVWQEYNAKIAERDAVERQTAAGAEESKFRKAAERKKARLRTQIGKAGILPIGSVELVAEENARELEIDALNIRRGGEVDAQSLRAGAQLSRLSGRSALLRGKAARRAGRTGAFATGLSGASQLTFKATE